VDRPQGFRPQLESLEDRALPNNLFNFGHPLGGLADSTGQFGLASDQLQLLAMSNTAATNNPGVAPVQSNYEGASYAQWAARWWQYSLSLPVDQSPFLDTTGANFTSGQSGKVWFLSGVISFNTNGEPLPPGEINTAVRNVSVPSGTALFFPVLNSEADNLNPFGPNTTFTADQLRAFAKQNMDLAENLQVQIDGRSINNLNDYRVQSPVFSYTLPDNNIVGKTTGVNVPGQTVSPAVDDGIYLMLRPLSVGHHTVHFAGDFGAGSFALDVTYNITVTPGKK